MYQEQLTLRLADNMAASRICINGISFQKIEKERAISITETNELKVLLNITGGPSLSYLIG